MTHSPLTLRTPTGPTAGLTTASAGRRTPQIPRWRAGMPPRRPAGRRGGWGMAPGAVQAQAGALAAPRRRPTTDRELTAAVLAAGFSACLGVPYRTSGRFDAPQ